MPKLYVTFGQDHAHHVNNNTFDLDCVAVIECESEPQGRTISFELFGSKFCTSYYEDRFSFLDMHYYPRGLIEAN